ncbi:MAG: DNA/RNA helicase [Gimesia sp.]|nr:DNA/RNA helicase [Gimesia sp.]
MIQENLTKELSKILDHINKGEHFLLSGGAGSGKTFTLVEVIEKLHETQPEAKIACITYTNAAANEINDRVEYPNLLVCTIHDFLWDNIKHFQKDLRVLLVELIEADEYPLFQLPGEISLSDVKNGLWNSEISYKEYVRLKEGIISHEEVIEIAYHMFRKFKKLCDILKDKYQFIFVDEYQDTQECVVELLLRELRKSDKRTIVGFFGDAMQSIYAKGIGDLNSYLEDDTVREVQKVQNRRNPRVVIDLANKLRKDGLIQEPSEDQNAPNMQNGILKKGDIKFLHSANPDIQLARDYLNWDFSDNEQTKELNLTLNLIADKAGFRSLMDIYDKDRILQFRDKLKKHIKESGKSLDYSHKTFGDVIELNKEVQPTKVMTEFIKTNPELYQKALGYNYELFSKIYVNKDQLLEDTKSDPEEINNKGTKRDGLIRHLYRLQKNIALYTNQKYNEFIRSTDFKVSSIADKKQLNEHINKLIGDCNKTIGEVIETSHQIGLCKKDDRLDRFVQKSKYIYDRVCSVNYSEFQKLYSYLEGQTPFSTQHKTKGKQFQNVLVVLDNGKWPDYNFHTLFIENGTETVLRRSQKIFYVCCTRAMENLAVFFHNPGEQVIRNAEAWFGSSNVINLDTLN